MGGKIISVEEQIKKELKYYFSLSILRILNEKKVIAFSILEKTNEKNAEQLGCRCIPILQ